MASMSSINTTHGAEAIALSNNSIILCSLSPKTPATRSGAAISRSGIPNS